MFFKYICQEFLHGLISHQFFNILEPKRILQSKVLLYCGEGGNWSQVAKYISSLRSKYIKHSRSRLAVAKRLATTFNSRRKQSQFTCYISTQQQSLPFGRTVVRVDISGKTSNQLKDYLKRFWEYYNTSPSLQKALETA